MYYVENKQKKKNSQSVLVLKTSIEIKLYEIDFICYWKYSIHMS